MLLILLVLFLLFCCFPFVGPGVYGASAGPYVGWSPLALLVIVVVILVLTGNLHL